VVSRIGKLTLAPTLKMQTSSGACLSASLRKEMISSSLRGIERAGMNLAAGGLDVLDQRRELVPLRRPANTVKPSEANFLAILPPMKSPAPMTAPSCFFSAWCSPAFA